MRPERILADVREVLPRDAIITTDVGWNKNGVGQQFPIYTPGSILTPGGYATMGFGAPAALGAKLAGPDRVVVALVGDGGFGQNPAMLATAVEEDIAVVWVVMNNYAYGTIAGLQMAHYGTDASAACSSATASPTRPTSPRSPAPTASKACRSSRPTSSSRRSSARSTSGQPVRASTSP